MTRYAIAVATLLIIAVAIMTAFVVIQRTPAETLRGEIEQAIAALNGEYDSLNKIFVEPPGPLRDQAVEKLRVNEAVMVRLVSDPLDRTAARRLLRDWSTGTDGPKNASRLYKLSYSADCPRIACDLRSAQAAFIVLARDAEYIADHCAFSGRVSAAPNQYTCDRSFNRLDPHVVGTDNDAIAFKAALEQATVDMDQYEAAFYAPPSPPSRER
jgi:hypothetical protein